MFNPARRRRDVDSMASDPVETGNVRGRAPGGRRALSYLSTTEQVSVSLEILLKRLQVCARERALENVSKYAKRAGKSQWSWCSLSGCEWRLSSLPGEEGCQ